MDVIELTTTPIKIEQYYQKVVCDYVGAVCCFSGIVRQDEERKKFKILNVITGRNFFIIASFLFFVNLQFFSYPSAV